MVGHQQQQASSKPWILELIPLLVVFLIVAHVLALVYWIFKLATEKQQQQQQHPLRRKEH